MRPHVWMAFVLATCAAPGLMPHSTAAAVRVCGKPVLGAISQASTERAARRAAITSWRQKAALRGRSYTSWRLAMRKRYKCARLKTGDFVCVAFALPCRILQRPPKPRGKPPNHLQSPSDGSRSI